MDNYNLGDRIPYGLRTLQEIDFSNWVLPTTNVENMNITSLAKRLLSKEDRTLIRAGYLTSDLELTTKGKGELLSLLFFEKKSELVKLAEEELKEQNRE